MATTENGQPDHPFTVSRGDRVAVALPPRSAVIVRSAAEELRVHLALLGLVPELTDEDRVDRPVVRLQPQCGPGLAVALEGLGREAGLIRTTAPGELTITAAGPRGILNSVYVLLEEVFGIRWLTPEATYVPDSESFDGSGLDRLVNPPFLYRALSCYKNESLEWQARHRLNYFTDCFAREFMEDDRLTDSFFYAGERHCHNVYELLAFGYPEQDAPPADIEKVHAEHPEYFALLDGQRRLSSTGGNRPDVSDQSGQICLTHPDMVPLLVRGIRRLVQSDPAAAFVAFSLRDNYDYCQCETCRAAEQRLGGMTRVYFDLANRVAEGIEPHCPNVLLGLLAYHGTQAPPRGMRLHRNIQVRYCPIRVSQYHAFDESEHNTVGGLNFETPPSMARPVEQLREWRRICDHVMVWYYTLNLPALHPQPSLRAHDRNLRLMRDLGAEGVYNEDNKSRNNALHPVRAHVLARLLWNPFLDLEALINEFVSLYYRAAAPAILAYIRLLHDPDLWDWQQWPLEDGRSRWEVEGYEQSWDWFQEKPDPEVYQTPHFFTLYGTRPPLKPAFFEQAVRLFDEAEAAVMHDPEPRARVRKERVSLVFACRRRFPPSHPLRSKIRSGS